MEKIKIFASADNHLGKNLKKKKALREFAINNFMNIPDKVLEEKDVDYIVFSGDVFDKENTDIQCDNAYAVTLQRLINIDTIKKIFIITGNHDQFNEYYQKASIDIVGVLDSDKIVICNKDHHIYHDEKEDILFFLLPYHKSLFLTSESGKKIINEKIDEIIFNTMNEEKYQNSYKILISHLAIKEWMPFSDEALTKDEIRAGNHFNLIILGDLHNETFQDIEHEVPIIYTGTTMHTSIRDLYKHNNVAKVIELREQSLYDVKQIKFPKPNIIIVNEDNLEGHKKDINENCIIITDNLEIHMKLKDRVLYSMYAPSVNKTTGEVAEIDSELDMETLDVNQISKDRVDADDTIDEETKEYLKKLIDIDVDSIENNELSEIVKTITMGELS